MKALKTVKNLVIAIVTTIPVVYHWNKDIIQYELKTFRAKAK